jgi:hypothetical protein
MALRDPDLECEVKRLVPIPTETNILSKKKEKEIAEYK